MNNPELTKGCFNHFRILQLFRSILTPCLDSHLNEDSYKSCVRSHLKVAVTSDFTVTLKMHSKGAWWQSPSIMSADVLDLRGNRNHLHTCFLWADSLNCLANTDSWDALKTRLIPGNWQTGFRRAFAEKIRVSKFPWSQASHGEGWLFIWFCIVTPEFLWEDHGRGPSSCEHLWPPKVMSRDKA